MINGSFALLFQQTVDLSKAAWMKDAWQWAVPLAVVGLVGLVAAIYKLVKMIGAARVCRVPLAAESVLDINCAGRLNLCLEVPMFKLTQTNNLDFRLADEQHDERNIELARSFAAMRTNNGYSRTFAVREFQLASAGRFRLKVAGLEPQSDCSECFIVVSRPIVLKSLLAVMSIILVSFLFIGGLILSITSLNVNK